jgi:hypothetical protein
MHKLPSMASLMAPSLVLTEKRIVPILTLAALPMGLPQAPLIPVYSRSNRCECLCTCTGTGKHFIDSKGVPWVNSASQMEPVLAEFLDEVFVGGDTACLETFGTDLLDFVGDEVDASLNDVISELLGTPQRWPSSCQHRIF